MRDDSKQRVNDDGRRRGHESEGIRFKGVLAGAGGILLLLLVAHGILLLVYGLLAERPTAVAPEAPLVRGPALIHDQPKQLRALRAAEKKRLESYGWVDEEAGIAHIPIERAMAIVAEKGLSRPRSERPPLRAPKPTSDGDKR